MRLDVDETLLVDRHPRQNPEIGNDLGNPGLLPASACASIVRATQQAGRELARRGRGSSYGVQVAIAARRCCAIDTSHCKVDSVETGSASNTAFSDKA